MGIGLVEFSCPEMSILLWCFQSIYDIVVTSLAESKIDAS